MSPLLLGFWWYKNVSEIYLLAKAQIAGSYTLIYACTAYFVEKIKPYQQYFLHIWAEAKQVSRYDCTNRHFQVCAWLCATFSSFRAPGWEGGAAASSQRFPCSRFRCLVARNSGYQESRVSGLEHTQCRKNTRDYNYWDSGEGWFLFVWFLNIVLPSLIGVSLAGSMFGVSGSRSNNSSYVIFFFSSGVLLEYTSHIYGDSGCEGRLLPGPAQHPGWQVSWVRAVLRAIITLPWRLQTQRTRSNIWDICTLEAYSFYWL